MKLLLHIGMGKAGSTSIQDFLYCNRQLLAEQGVLYPRSIMDRTVQNIGFTTHNPITGPGYQRLFGVLHDELCAAGCPTAIISAENTWARLRAAEHLRTFRGFLERLGFEDIGIILYLREPGAFFTSYYSQLIRRGDITLPGPAGLAPLMPGRNDRVRTTLDYRGGLENWCTVFGRERLQVRLFSREAFHEGDLLHDFMQALGLPWREDYQLPGRVNESLNLREMALLTAVNQRLPGRYYVNGTLKHLIYRLASRHLSGSDPQLRFAPPPAVLEEVRQHCAAGCEWVRRSFFPQRLRLFEMAPDAEEHSALTCMRPGDWEALAGMVCDLASQYAVALQHNARLQQELQAAQAAAAEDAAAPAPDAGGQG